MEITMSPLRSGLKVFLHGITWEKIVSGFKDESVKVLSFGVMMNNIFSLKESRTADDDFLTLTIPINEVPISKIKEKIIISNPLKKMDNIDETQLKQGFPNLVKRGLSAADIWELHVRDCFKIEEPIEVKLGNPDFLIESCDIVLRKFDSYIITFHSKVKLIEFFQNATFDISSEARTELITAARDGKSYATDGLRAAFDEAGIIDRINNLRVLKSNLDAELKDKKQSKEFALSPEHTSLKLFMQGVSWKDLLHVFEEETVDVFELNIIALDKISPDDDSFYIDDISSNYDASDATDSNWLSFRRRKLLFKDLIKRVSSLKLQEDFSEPFNTKIWGRYFEMDINTAFICLTFWQKDRLIDYLDRMNDIIPHEISSQIKNALEEGIAYCTEGLREDFEKASNRDRTERLIELIKESWEPHEEEKLKIALAHVTKTIPAQLGHEPSPNETRHYLQAKGNKNWLVYNRLFRDGVGCFDGNGEVYGFNGETVIRYTIEMCNKLRNKEYSITMNRLLQEYTRKFGETAQVPKPR